MNLKHGLQGLGMLSVLLGTWFSVSTPATAALAQGQCNEAREVDYEAPFSALPSVSGIPLDRNLPFGPPRLKLRALQEQVLIGPALFGYEAFIDRISIRHPVKGDFKVQLKLFQVNQQGRRVSVLSTKEEKVGTIASRAFNGRPLRLKVPGRNGIYLFDMRFRRADGQSLHHYAEYLRVVKPTVDVRLKMQSESYALGETARFWIENRGTREADPVGTEFTFERYENGQWVKAPGSPTGFPRLRLKPLVAGEAGFCSSFVIPSEEPPGLYRVKKSVIIRSLNMKKSLTAEFQVAGNV
jgi:hypothetical protein